MDVSVLGPLIVGENGKSMVPSAGKQRQVLALLVLRGDRTVQVGTLMEELWGGCIPRSGATTLQTYILQLRNKIATLWPEGSGRSPKDLLTTCFGGYMLKIGGGRSDLRDFETYARNGMSAYEAGDLKSAVSLFDRALDQWDGEALMDVPHGRILQREIVSLEQMRMNVLERRIDACLRLGRQTALLPDLGVLVDEHPMHEGLRAQLILALYRSGNVRRALEEFQRLRASLVEELGIEPSMRLRRLHQAILAGDPILETEGEVLPQLIG
ncbi:AfsR/SARP family transcriptional regulator [Amycolatopsis sp. H6(2020)]|nr:AfsR/SARP family transcriptional regulator [Amycolatopsis sp. H6(2020)]